MPVAIAPQLEFRDNTLLVQAGPAYIRIRWNDEPVAERLTALGRWRECFPDFRLLSPLHGSPGVNHHEIPVVPHAEFRMPHSEALDAFRRLLPEAPAQLCEPFCSHQWPLLKLLRQYPKTLDWACRNPVLAYALANNDQLRGTLPEVGAVQAVWYSYRKQKVISEWLGFPGTTGMTKLLRKLDPEDVSLSRLRRLRKALRNNPRVLDLLSHQPCVTAGMVELASNQRITDAVGPNLLRDVLDNGDYETGLRAVDRLSRSFARLKEIAPRRPVRRFASLAEIREFHDAVEIEYDAHQRQCRAMQEARRLRLAEIANERRRVERAQRDPRRAVPRRPFPPPPLPGTVDIVPLTCPAQLREEGRLQRNCVGKYETEVRQGLVYIYKVLAPQRATLAIRKGLNNCWYRNELEIAANRKVRRSTARAVDKWLSRQWGKVA